MTVRISLYTTITLALAAAGCATTNPPSELVDARNSYERARNGPAAKLNPAGLHTARLAIDSAEKSFEQDGDTGRTKDLAYTAERRARIAEAQARTAQAMQTRQQRERDARAAQGARLNATTAELGRANTQLAVQGTELEKERDARAEAEKRAAQASADLAKYATVKQEPRGMVITLSGGVLFASGKSDLLADAQLKLNGVAEALTQQDPNAKMVVEGHTDSQGAVSYNQELSQRRAETVRAYLVSHGIAADRVRSQGFGSSRSIADNKSPEGRANNRRVEIVVERAPLATM